MGYINTQQELASQEAIFKAQIKECCRPHYEIFFSALLAVAFVVFLCFDKGSNPMLFGWAAITLAVLSVRYGFINWFNRLPDTDIARVHSRLFSGIMLIWGCCWAAATFAFFPLLSIPQQAAWFAMFMVMVSASATSHAVFLNAFFAFALPYFLSIVWMVATQYPSPYHVNAIIVTLVMITQVGAARKGNQAILESLRLRFENLDLIGKLQSQKETAELANLSKSKFLAAASHDLRQPLQALILFSTALEDALDDKNKMKSLATQIGDSVGTLQGLFDALLDISRLDAGTLECQKSHFDLQNVLNKLENDFYLSAQSKGINLFFDEKHPVINSDPTLLLLVLQNLLSNALRYTKKGTVTIRLIEQETKVNIEVEDTGIGIPPEHQQTIFDEFVQLHNPERDRNKGLGLGLSIVKRVARLIDAELSVRSECGKGSCFSLVVEKGQATSVSEVEPEYLKVASSGGENIVVIDDEVAIQGAMRALLEGWGYQVLTAADLSEAEQLLTSHSMTPKCIIADLRLREGKSGVDAVNQLRKQYGLSIPALIVTGDIAVERLQEVKNQGLEMLHKPIQPARLRSFLNNSL